MLTRYLGYFASSIWRPVLHLASAGDSCKVSSGRAEAAVWTEEACLREQAVLSYMPVCFCCGSYLRFGVCLHTLHFSVCKFEIPKGTEVGKD